MNATELQNQLVEWSALHSGHDSRRDYIGMSGAIDCEALIYRRFFESKDIPVELKLRTKITYELEQDLLRRLIDMGLAKPGIEIQAFSGMLKGHTDGEIKGNLLEIKTVAQAEHLPDGRIPARVYWQVQAYMHFGDYRAAYVIYLDRGTGLLGVFDVFYSKKYGEMIEKKLWRVVYAVQTKQEPECTCGKCK